MTRKIGTSISSALLVLGAFAFGCGDDDDDDGGNMDAGGLMDSSMPPTDGGMGDSGPAPVVSTFTGYVTPSTDVTARVPGRKVSAFNLTNGAFIAGAEGTSDSKGDVTIPNRPNNSGAFVLGGGEFQDTWNFPPSRLGEEKIIRLGTVQAATLVPGIAMYPTDQNASPVAGSVLWRNTAAGRDEFVGCATIEEGNGIKDVRYFKGTLPTALANRPAALGTQPAKGANLGAPDNEAEAGKYFIGNVEGGTRTIIAKVRGVEVGRVTFFITPRKNGTPIGPTPTPSNLTLGSLWVNTPTNPTPADCM
jgi:hypothetical protein